MILQGHTIFKMRISGFHARGDHFMVFQVGEIQCEESWLQLSSRKDCIKQPFSMDVTMWDHWKSYLTMNWVEQWLEIVSSLPVGHPLAWSAFWSAFRTAFRLGAEWPKWVHRWWRVTFTSKSLYFENCTQSTVEIEGFDMLWPDSAHSFTEAALWCHYIVLLFSAAETAALW